MPLLSNASLYLPRRRNNFAGSNDKYGRRRGPIVTSTGFSIDQAIDGLAPYDPTGVAIGDSEKDDIATRLANYARAERFYEGDHWQIEVADDLDRKSMFNFTKVIVDKASDWMCAKGWQIVGSEGNEEVAELLNLVWNGNNRLNLTQKGAQAGAIKGEHYIYVTVRTVDQYGKRLPRSDWTVRLQALSPESVFPIWSGSEERRMVACLIQYPIADPDNAARTCLYSMYITSTRIYTYIDAHEDQVYDNPIGEVPVVHFPNFELHNTFFGDSDIEHIIPLNVEYNQIAYATRRIIKYHAEPTTVIFGARASQLEKGANAVWSNLPVDAKVENLKLDDNLEANFQYMQMIKDEICELSCTPKIAFDSFDVRVATSSAAALELMFQPLLEKTRRRQVAHKPAVREVNRMILLYHSLVIGTDIEILSDDPQLLADTDCEYSTPLPRDEGVEIDLAVKRFNAGIWSRAEMIRQVGKVKNHRRLVVELLADKRAEMAETLEQQKALQGERPSSMFTFLGSTALSEDMETLAAQVSELEKLQAEEFVPPKPPTPGAPSSQAVKIQR